MAALQGSNLLSSSSFSNQQRICAGLHLPSRLGAKAISLPKLPASIKMEGLGLKERNSDDVSYKQPRQPMTADKDDDLVAKLLAIAESVADRAEMHAIIGDQRNNWNHLFLHSINSINLTASLMAGISAAFTVGEAAPHVLAFKLSSVVLFTAATGMMLVVNKIQPSQLAEEQRNATRLWKQLERSIHNTLALGAPAESDVEEAMEKVLALDKAYPLPLLPGMLEKFPETVEPTCWWPKMRRREQETKKACANGMAGGNGWSKELEEEMMGILRVLKMKDEEHCVRVGKLVLNINKTLAISGPLFAGLAAVGAGLIGSPGDSPLPVLFGVVGGALAAVVNTMEHGGQVGMVFEILRNCGGFYRRLQEEIESNLREREVERRENGELFRVKMALQLGRSLSELKGFASYASPSCKDADVQDFAGKLF